MTKDYLLSKMTWQEVESALNETDIVVVPIGSTEQHGPALPLDNDAYIATELATRIAERLWDIKKIVVAPTISFGFSPHHMEFKGTITLSEATLANMIVDICRSLVNHGFRKIILINGHGGNSSAIDNALHRMNGDTEAKIFNIEWWRFAADIISEVASRPLFHACDMETSLAWYLSQRVIDEKRVDEPGRIPIPGFFEADMLSPPPKVSTSFMMKEITDSGVVGYSTRATKEKGKIVADAILERLEEFIFRISEL